MYCLRINEMQGISIEYVLGIQYFEKVLVLDIQYILRRSIGKSINTFRLEIQYPILFSRIFQSFQSKSSKFSSKLSSFTWTKSEKWKLCCKIIISIHFGPKLPKINHFPNPKSIGYWKYFNTLRIFEKYWVLVFQYNFSGVLSIGQSILLKSID